MCTTCSHWIPGYVWLSSDPLHHIELLCGTLDRTQAVPMETKLKLKFKKMKMKMMMRIRITKIWYMCWNDWVIKWSTLHNTTLDNATQHYTALQYNTQHNPPLHFTTMHNGHLCMICDIRAIRCTISPWKWAWNLRTKPRNVACDDWWRWHLQQVVKRLLVLQRQAERSDRQRQGSMSWGMW